MNIISTFYISKYSSHLDILRSKELEQCLIHNLMSPFIEKIHLFVDDIDAMHRLNEMPNLNKIIIIDVGKKPKYSDFFNYILNNVQNKLCMITNADIFLHEMNTTLLEQVKENKIMFALTRYEHDMTHPLMDDYGGSHDAYIFNSKFINKTIINEHTQFYQNFPGIETHIIKAFHDNGFKILNPCKQIKIVHLHKTDLRRHGEWIGLHKCGDFTYHKNSCWWVPPVVL
jgi:hypothetical protein